jgi:halocyanin-like protein
VGPASLDDQRVLCGNRIERGSLSLTPWIGEPNGLDGLVDRRGQEAVTVDVGAGPDGRALDPALVAVDRGTEVTWEWTGDGGEHYVVLEGRIHQDPSDVPEPRSGPYAESKTLNEVGLYRFACYNHHDEGMYGSVLVQGDGTQRDALTSACGDVPSGDGIGHTGGDSPWG